jgi:hypothetical protein
MFKTQIRERTERPVETKEDRLAAAPQFDPGDRQPENSSSGSNEQRISGVQEGALTPGVSVELATTMEAMESLSAEESSDRLRLERKVERAFYEAGVALRELRERRLYRSTHKTFEEYCRERFGFQRRHCYQLIEAAVVVDNLCANSAQNDPETNSAQILPTSEAQVRSMTSLEPNEQRSVWQQAVEEAGGKVPPARIVKGIVEKLKSKPLALASDSCSVGDVFTLTRLTLKESKYNGCWAVAIALNEFTLEVDVHDGTLRVKPENLDPIDSPQAQRELPAILDRIRRLRQVDSLDRVAYNVLESLGKQTYLTELEEKVLQCMEAHYGLHELN